MSSTDVDEAAYIASVLTLYADLPDTPARPSPVDQAVARKLQEDSIPLPLVESAFLLATLRRLTRDSDLPALPKIRSLAYFLPVIAELRQQPLPAGISITCASRFTSFPWIHGLLFKNLRFWVSANTAGGSRKIVI